ncbi:F-box/LRR-repeat protein At3g59190-like [Silene latifolia]|uniref:F-box/LRR-repeat protein At3g59190-like n=1 Tax=Silene latifolia TaxID=37657 RepID=UPI003D77DCD6
MESSMKLGNNVKGQRNKRRLDKISNLPDELLVLILSFLPTWYAVRTSIISRRWRYLFTLTDCLSFDDTPCFRGAITTVNTAGTRRFENFVYKVLELHQMSPIKKFSLVCIATYDKSHLNAWVKYAIQKGVQELQYKVYECELPYDLVMCKTLVKLEMRLCVHRSIQIPPSSWLPSLKILHLNFVRFGDYHSTERLLSSCEFLEELTLKNCALYTRGHVTISLGQLKVLIIKNCNVSNGFFEIEAPNLAYLIYDSIAGVKIVPLWKHSCSLVEAKLHFDCHADDSRSLEDHRDILRAAAFKTTELHLRPNSVECLFMIGNMEQVPDFPSLTRLHLSYFSYDSWKNVKSVLDKSPQLETIVFTADLHDCDRRSSAPPPSESLLPFSCHAKVIDEVNHLCGHERSSLLLLGHFLKNARVMKKLIVRKCHGFDDNGVTTS